MVYPDRLYILVNKSLMDILTLIILSHIIWNGGWSNNIRPTIAAFISCVKSSFTLQKQHYFIPFHLEKASMYIFDAMVGFCFIPNHLHVFCVVYDTTLY